MFALQKTGDPKKIKPPNRVGQKLSGHERPSLPEWKQGRPLRFGDRFLRITTDVIKFGSRNAWVLAWFVINRKPERQPDETKRSNSDECAAPAPARVQPGHHNRGEHRAKACARIKYARGQGALSFRKPFGYRLDTGGEDGGFAES